MPSVEREKERERERELEPEGFYEFILKAMLARRDRAKHGRIVLKRTEMPWQLGKQGKVGFYLHPKIADSALEDWRVFAHEIRTHSGRHTHQGGLVLYVTKGRGYTIVNGKKEAWKEGDLVVLPVLPGGCEHQHFNDDDRVPSEWVAFIFDPLQYATGSLLEQNENSPEWREPHELK